MNTRPVFPAAPIVNDKEGHVEMDLPRLCCAIALCMISELNGHVTVPSGIDLIRGSKPSAQRTFSSIGRSRCLWERVNGTALLALITLITLITLIILRTLRTLRTLITLISFFYSSPFL